MDGFAKHGSSAVYDMQFPTQRLSKPAAKIKLDKGSKTI
jgi:hypothetical protein